MGMHAYEKRQSTTTKTETDELIRQKKIYKLKIVWFWLLRLRWVCFSKLYTMPVGVFMCMDDRSIVMSVLCMYVFLRILCNAHVCRWPLFSVASHLSMCIMYIYTYVTYMRCMLVVKQFRSHSAPSLCQCVYSHALWVCMFELRWVWLPAASGHQSNV